MLLRNGSGQGTVEMRLHVDLLNEQNLAVYSSNTRRGRDIHWKWQTRFEPQIVGRKKFVKCVAVFAVLMRSVSYTVLTSHLAFILTFWHIYCKIHNCKISYIILFYKGTVAHRVCTVCTGGVVNRDCIICLHTYTSTQSWQAIYVCTGTFALFAL